MCCFRYLTIAVMKRGFWRFVITNAFFSKLHYIRLECCNKIFDERMLNSIPLSVLFFFQFPSKFHFVVSKVIPFQIHFNINNALSFLFSLSVALQRSLLSCYKIIACAQTRMNEFKANLNTLKVLIKLQRLIFVIKIVINLKTSGIMSNCLINTLIFQITLHKIAWKGLHVKSDLNFQTLK